MALPDASVRGNSRAVPRCPAAGCSVPTVPARRLAAACESRCGDSGRARCRCTTTAPVRSGPVVEVLLGQPSGPADAAAVRGGCADAALRQPCRRPLRVSALLSTARLATALSRSTGAGTRRLHPRNHVGSDGDGARSRLRRSRRRRDSGGPPRRRAFYGAHRERVLWDQRAGRLRDRRRLRALLRARGRHAALGLAARRRGARLDLQRSSYRRDPCRRPVVRRGRRLPCLAPNRRARGTQCRGPGARPVARSLWPSMASRPGRGGFTARGAGGTRGPRHSPPRPRTARAPRVRNGGILASERPASAACTWALERRQAGSRAFRHSCPPSAPTGPRVVSRRSAGLRLTTEATHPGSDTGCGP